MPPLGARVLIQAAGGVELDAQVHEKQTAQCVGIVLIHPYALLGGTMFDPVVTEVYRQAVQSPAFKCVLRYNQRGVGRSGGTKNILGRQDLGDVEAVCQFLLSKLPGAHGRIFVVGYSWGACLATKALSVPQVAAYVGISFPLGGLAMLLRPSRHFTTLCQAQHLPRLLIAGTQDQYAKYATLLRLVQQSGGREVGGQETERILARDAWQQSGNAAGVPHQTCTAGALQYSATGGALQEAVIGTRGAAEGQQSCSGGGVEAEEEGAEAPSLAARPPKLLLLRSFPGADHFWMEALGEMAEGVVQWLEGVADTEGDP